MHPDYSNPNRILNSQLRQDLTLLNLDDTKYRNVAFFKCPVVSQFYEENDLEESSSSFVVFKSDQITNLLRNNYLGGVGIQIH